MENSIKIEMKPTNETLSLLRLIISYFSQTLDFNIGDIDNMKEILTRMNILLNPNWNNQGQIKIEIEFDSQELNSVIYCLMDAREKEKFEKSCKEIKYPAIMNESIYLKEIENDKVAIFLKMRRRDVNA